MATDGPLPGSGGGDAGLASQIGLQRAPTPDRGVSLAEARRILEGRFDVIGPDEINAMGEKIGKSGLPAMKFFGAEDQKPEDSVGFNKATLEAVQKKWVDHQSTSPRNIGKKGTLLWIPAMYQKGTGNVETLTTTAMVKEVVPPSDGLVHKQIQTFLEAAPMAEQQKAGGRWALFFPMDDYPAVYHKSHRDGIDKTLDKYQMRSTNISVGLPDLQAAYWYSLYHCVKGIPEENITHLRSATVPLAEGGDRYYVWTNTPNEQTQVQGTQMMVNFTNRSLAIEKDYNVDANPASSGFGNPDVLPMVSMKSH